jgi:hypothetical protein
MADSSANSEHTYDVFLSHSSKDKSIVRELAVRLRGDGIRVWFDEWVIQPGDSIPSKIEQGLENSRVLMLCMSKNAFGSDWATLESQTFRFRDPLNKMRHFLPLRLDDSSPPGTLKQFLYVDWPGKDREESYQRLLIACGATPTKSTRAHESREANELENDITESSPSLADESEWRCV